MSVVFATATAQAAPGECKPVPVQRTAAGTCSVSAMVAAVSGRQLPWHYVSGQGEPVPPVDSPRWQAQYADFRGAPFPGQGRLALSGLINASGAACAHHVQALGDGKRSALARLDDIDTSRLPAKARERIAEARKRARDARAGQAAGGQGSSAATGVVLTLFTPSDGLAELAVESLVRATRPNRLRTGVGGWPANSGGAITVVLPGTAPEDVVAGKRYRAIVRGANQTLYTDATGRMRRFPRGNLDSHSRSLCEKGKRNAAARWQHHPSVAASARSMDCGVKSWFLGTTRRVSASGLSGEVIIEGITDERVTGRFQLSGDARLDTSRYRLVRGSAPDADGINYPKPGTRALKRVRTDRTRRGPLTVRGHFAAPNHTSGLKLSPNYRGEDRRTPSPPARTVVLANSGGDAGGDERAAFRVEAHRPGAGRRNVDGTAPAIGITFNHRVDPATVSDDTVTLTYLNSDGAMEAVPVTVRRPSPRRIRLRPALALRDGVRYRVTVEGDSDGVRSLAGDRLIGDYRWHFSTLVNLDRNESVPAVRDHLTATAGIEPHVFQTARDADLVPGKNTLTRVYVKWRADRTVDENWQVERFMANVRVTGDGALYPERQRVLVERPDQWTDPQRRRAETSINFHGWRPRSGDGGTLTAHVEPVDQCAKEPRVFESEPLRLDYTPLSPTLDVDYYVVRAGHWSGDALAEGNYQWVPQTARDIARRGGRYTEQNFPVWRTRMTYRGTLAAGTGWFTGPSGNRITSGILNEQPTDRYVVQQIRRTLATQPSNADAILLFMADDVQSLGGRSYREATGPLPGIVGVFLDRSRKQMASKAIVDITHELGHVFLANETHLDRDDWLRHYATTADQQIEGFRLPRFGAGGTNKSHSEGNGNPDGNKIFPLMVAGQTPEGGTFITNDNYRRLVPRLAEAPSLAGRRGGPLRLAARGDSVPAAARPGWLVQGRLQAAGNTAGIATVTPAPGRNSTPRDDDTPWRAVVLGHDGERLAAVPFTPEPRPDRSDAGSLRSFAVRVPRLADATAVAIEHDGRVLARRNRSETPPEVTLRAPRTGDGTTRLRWDGRDADGDELRYDVSYTRDGTRYRPLAVGITAEELVVSTREMPPGPGPAVRVTARDGFDQGQDTVAVSAVADPRVVAGPPTDGDRLPGHSDLTVSFNTPLDPATVSPETVRLLGPDGQPVAARTLTEDGARTLHVVPKAGLREGNEYTLVLGEGVRSAAGRRPQGHREWLFTAGTAPLKPAATVKNGATAARDVTPGDGAEGVGEANDRPEGPIRVRDPREDADGMPFSRDKVRYWLRTRIATNRLQERIKREGGGPREFFTRQPELLRAAGWSPGAFKKTGQRIRMARGAMKVERSGGADPGGYIERTKDDWPAVRPFLDEIRALTDWVAGNRADPPDLER